MAKEELEAFKDGMAAKSKDEVLAEVEALRPDLFFPAEWSDAQRETAVELTSRGKIRTDLFASIPMVCRAEKCHPPGTLIRTNLGDVAIEDLDPDIHLICAWDGPNRAVRGGFKNGNIKGYSFSMGKRFYEDELVRITTNTSSHDVTRDHISLVKWNPDVYDHFAVYLMRKGESWRVGKVKLFVNRSSGSFGPTQRARSEKADDLWILGVYEKNTEALLAEDFFSVELQASKVCFKAHEGKGKWEGLYKWASQDDLDIHHKNTARTRDHYAAKLRELGLDVEMPIWSKVQTNELLKTRMGMGSTLQIQACNIISNAHMVAVIPEDLKIGKYRKYATEWESLNREDVDYSGYVYSLDVDRYHTYFANSIATHNCVFATICPLMQREQAPKGLACPFEMAIVQEFFQQYMHQFGVSPDNLVEVAQIRDMVDQQVQMMRKTKTLSLEHFIQENVVGIDNEGEPIIQKQLHQAVEYEDKIFKRLEKLRANFLATREKRAQVGVANLDTAQKMSNILDQLRQQEYKENRKIRELLGTLDHDEYIEGDEIVEAEIVEDEEGV